MVKKKIEIQEETKKRKRKTPIQKEETSKIEENEYTSSDLQVLRDLQHVRARPGMYIGDTSKTGFHHLVWEIFDNSIDEISNGFGSFVSLTINNDKTITIEDNGRGIPIENHPTELISGVRVIFEILGAGGKFDKKAYKYSGGLHGVGASVVNALSEFVNIEIKRSGNIYAIDYLNQKIKRDLTIIGKCNKKDTGTKVTFMPDKSIFKEEDLAFDADLILERLKEVSYQNKDVTIIFKDNIKGIEKSICNKDGILAYLKEIEKNEIIKPIYIKEEKEDFIIECALQYVENNDNNILSFVNNIKTLEGGTHEVGFKSGLTKAIIDTVKEFGKTKKIRETEFNSNDVFTGLNVFLNLKVSEPQFVGQTKTKLGNMNIKTIVNSVIYDNVKKILSENKVMRTKIIDRIIEINNINNLLKHQKETESKKKELKNKKRNSDKVAGCNSKNPFECEVYMVEGDSAGGCFTGDTKVFLVDGRILSMENIVKEFNEGMINYVYSKDLNNNLTKQPIMDAFLSKKNAEIIKVYLDNGETIKCTPDHKFMLRNGKYKEAKDLTIKDSLMSLNNKDLEIQNIEINEDSNYRVIKIEQIYEKQDVYDITVPPYNNFALASGIFVHNSAKQGRNRLFQAIISLRGKPLNVEKKSVKEVLSNLELSLIIQELGTGILNDFDITKLKYNKIIIMADADVDGSHIQLILLTFFYRYMPELIRKGHIYLAKPPLYKVYKKTKTEEKTLYAFNDTELEKYKKKLGTGCLVQRFKGLGKLLPLYLGMNMYYKYQGENIL